MAWIKSHTVLLRHRKLAELAKALRLKPVYALGHLHALWHAAMEQQEDGILSSWSDDFIAECSAVTTDAHQYVRLLHEFGWLENKVIHDWLDYAGSYLTSKYKSNNRQRLVEIWRSHGREYGAGSEEEVNRKEEGSSRLDKTRLENSKETKPPEKPPADHPPEVPNPKVNVTEPPKKPYGPPKTDVQKVVAGFKAVMNVPDDDREWDAVYFRRYSRPAADLLRLCGGDILVVADCIDQVSSAMEKKGLSWTPETIVKHAGDWKNGRLFK